MEDIKTIKQNTFELKQYANAILDDIDKRIAEERRGYSDSIDEAVNSRDKKIDELKDKDEEIEKLKNENAKLLKAIKNVKSALGSALEICEGESDE